MVAVVQWLERLLVEQDVAGSNPVSHPIPKLSASNHKIIFFVIHSDQHSVKEFPMRSENYCSDGASYHVRGESAPSLTQAQVTEAVHVIKSYVPHQNVSGDEAREFSKTLFRRHFGQKNTKLNR